MIHNSNTVSGWVYSQVLRFDQAKDRADMITNFVKVMQHCKELNNINAMFEIVAGLESSAINRMKKSWDKLDSKTKTSYKSMKDLVSRANNFKNLREHLKTVMPPCIPYLGMFLTDLTFIDTGNPDMLKREDSSSELINFVKYRRTASVIKQLQHFQQTGFSLEVVQELRDYLNNVKETNINEDMAYKLSLNFEARE